jgi:signal peptidase I
MEEHRVSTMKKSSTTEPSAPKPTKDKVAETPLEAVASICSVLVVGVFVLTFLAQNYLIPSGSMEKTLLIGDHLVVDRISLSPPAKWMPLVHYREPRRGDITVFKKPVFQPGIDEPDADGQPGYTILVKRLIGVPGDHIRLHKGIVILNGVAQPPPKDGSDDPGSNIDQQYLDEFPSIPPAQAPSGAETAGWADDAPNHIVDGELVVPPGMYFMMGDNRHNSLDSRYWGFVPRQNIMGRPLFNYWSFESSGENYTQTETSENIRWMFHVVTHFISDTRWSRTFHLTR